MLTEKKLKHLEESACTNAAYEELCPGCDIRAMIDDWRRMKKALEKIECMCGAKDMTIGVLAREALK